MPRYALLLSYRGDAGCGWERHGDGTSLAEAVDAALARLGGESPCRGASRTDAGVHAHGQVAAVDFPRAVDPVELARRLDRQLPAGIACRAAAAVVADWDVLAVRDKSYAYLIDVGTVRDPFSEPFAWRPPAAVDPARLAAGAALFPGRRDFAAFQRTTDLRPDAVRTLHACSWRHMGRFLVCRLRADGFVFHLARSLVGAMVCHARDGCTWEDLARTARGEASEASRQMAPAHGLHLVRIRHRAPPAWCRPG